VREKLGRASEVRELFDLRSNARVYELVRRGILPGAVRVGRQVRFDMAKLLIFIENGGLPVQKARKDRGAARSSAADVGEQS